MNFSKNSNGFTLIEVVISIMILGLVMLGFLGMFTNGHRWVFDAGRRSQDTQQDRETLEEELILNTSGGESISIDFDNGTTSITVDGEIRDAGNLEVFDPVH